MGGRVKRAVSGVLTTLILVALLVAGVFASSNRQAINDHFAAQNFQPSAEIEALTERLQLTDAGHRIFWASEPTLDGSQAFNEQCSQVEHSEKGHILGCFTGSRRIHLFSVSDERLNGIVEVTAAHELLHAAFSRIDGDARSSLVKKLNALYEELRGENPELEQRMSVYAGLSKASFANELHSVLGTEVRELPAWLEQHYAEWFQNRSVIIDFFDSYHSVFVELKERSEALQTEMAELREDVERRSAVYRDAVDAFNADWEKFIHRNNAFEFSDDPAEFYRLRAGFEARRDVLGAELESLNADIAHYEELRKELIALSELNRELEQHLDSSLAPPTPVPTPLGDA